MTRGLVSPHHLRVLLALVALVGLADPALAQTVPEVMRG